MKEEIEEFKKRNGNNNYTEKDFLMYISAKVERVEERLIDGAGKISANRVKSTIALWGLAVILAAVLAQIFGFI